MVEEPVLSYFFDIFGENSDMRALKYRWVMIELYLVLLGKVGV